jgi:hypothetical protein
MHNVWSRRAFLTGAWLLALTLSAAAVVPASAQDRETRYAIERAQVGVRTKIVQERGGDWGEVTFDQTRTQTWRVSDRQTGVRGVGTHAPNGSAARQFTYEAVVDHRNGKIESVSYDMSGGRGEGRGGGNGGGRDDRRVPRWLVGTFYGRSPANGRRVTLTINREGEATAVFNNGSREQGTYNNGRIRFNSSGDWDVSRVDEGLRAATGRRSEVFTTDPSRGGGGDDDDDADGRVPRWLRGTFRGTTDSGESELTIRADGTATARSLNKNQTYRGTYSDGRLRFDWGTYDVQRTSDGIRTVEVNNRNNKTDYRRTGDY